MKEIVMKKFFIVTLGGVLICNVAFAAKGRVADMNDRQRAVHWKIEHDKKHGMWMQAKENYEDVKRAYEGYKNKIERKIQKMKEGRKKEIENVKEKVKKMHEKRCAKAKSKEREGHREEIDDLKDKMAEIKDEHGKERKSLNKKINKLNKRIKKLERARDRLVAEKIRMQKKHERELVGEKEEHRKVIEAHKDMLREKDKEIRRLKEVR
jgi:chromosome segregation ATPase